MTTALADPVFASLVEVLEHAGAMFFSVRAEHGQLAWHYVSKAYAGLLGSSVEEIMATPVQARVVESQRSQHRRFSQAFLGGGDIPVVLEVTLRHSAGHELPIEVTLARRATSDAGMVGVVMVRGPNVAPHQLGLLEADRISLVAALAAGFAHEINNPLTSVLLNLRSLRKLLVAHHPEATLAQGLRCLDDITTGAERIATNVRAFQTLASPGTVTRIDLAAVVSSALRLAGPTLDANAHVIRQIFPVPPVRGEEARVGQAVLAMMMFAISGFDATGGGAANRIVVLVEERAGEVVIEVGDNGRALADDDIGRAFDPFFRSPTRGAGVGVGLGVARSVATALGGEVVLAPRGGGGAVVTMRLPVDR